jgi:serine/threonine protein phosphatase 1
MFQPEISDIFRPRIPDYQRLYAIGDIHGRADLLRLLLKEILADAKAHEAEQYLLVFLGDYINKGPATKEVLDILHYGLPELLRGLPGALVPFFLRGNHEEYFLHYMDGGSVKADWLKSCIETTIASYDEDKAKELIEGERLDQNAIRKKLKKLLPPEHAEHVKFMKRMKYFLDRGDYFLSHGGIRPGIAFDRQMNKDLLITCPEFLNEINLDKVVKIAVHGHRRNIESPEEPDIRRHRIGIDTLVPGGNCLTALVLQGSERSFLNTKQIKEPRLSSGDALLAPRQPLGQSGNAPHYGNSQIWPVLAAER